MLTSLALAKWQQLFMPYGYSLFLDIFVAFVLLTTETILDMSSLLPFLEMGGLK
jgi:hypothetical protein